MVSREVFQESFARGSDSMVPGNLFDVATSPQNPVSEKVYKDFPKTPKPPQACLGPSGAA